MLPSAFRSHLFGLFCLLAVSLSACSALSGQEPALAPPPNAAPVLQNDPASANPTHYPSTPAPSITPDLSMQGTVTSAALPTSNPTPSPTPMPGLIQLTNNGCCVEPFWSPDGTRVLFLDKPSPNAPTGFWGVGLGGGEPTLYVDRLGLYSPDMSLLAYPQDGQTVVERLSDGQRWTIPNEGRAISFSPDGTLVAWTAGETGPPFDTPLRQVWISSFDGTQPRQAAQVIGGGFSGWFPDGRILVSGKMDASEPLPGLWAVSLQDGGYTRLASGERLRGVSLSPGGSWLIYQKVFDPDPGLNGIWLVNTKNGETRRLELFGGYRWQDDQHLLLIPLDVSQANHRLWQVDAATGVALPLTDLAALPFKVANGDWSVSPDGKKIAFVSALDRNIWLIDLEP